MLAYLRSGETFAEVTVGFGVSTATAWRYVLLPMARRPDRQAIHAFQAREANAG